MDEPEYYRGSLKYPRGDDVEVVEFYYPADVSWGCAGCGDSCGDVDKLTSMILLLPEDVKRIEETGAESFYEDWDGDNFTVIICKENGKCVFHNGSGCRIYDHRALLCMMYPFWLEKQEEFFLLSV